MTGPAWAALFPGQGSQAVGMGRELALAYPEAAEVFAEADDVLGEALSTLCFEGPDDKLVLTRNTQPALLTVSVAAWRVLAARAPRPACAAGHSLGEYSALVAAGVLSFSDAVRAVRLRGEAMQQAVPVGVGAMAALIGLGAPQVEALCAAASRHGEVVVPANFNAPDQIVVAGHKAAVDRAVEAAPGAGAKRAMPLAVSAPFHSPLMTAAAERLAEFLEGVKFRVAKFPVVANVDAAPCAGEDAARERLVQQVASPVRWVDTMRTIESALGVAKAVEIGPGRVLCGLARRCAEKLEARHFGDPPELDATLAALAPADEAAS